MNALKVNLSRLNLFYCWDIKLWTLINFIIKKVCIIHFTSDILNPKPHSATVIRFRYRKISDFQKTTTSDSLLTSWPTNFQLIFISSQVTYMYVSQKIAKIHLYRKNLNKIKTAGKCNRFNISLTNLGKNRKMTNQFIGQILDSF